MTSFWWIVLLLALGLGMLFVFARRSQPGLAAVPQAAELDPEPDTPRAFGYKISWLAFRTDDAESVARALLLAAPRRANWRSGITAAYLGGVFVAPPLDGWVLAVSFDVPELEAGDGRWRRAVPPMAARFPELHYYATHRVVDYHAWARFEAGELVRAYAYVGESGETLVDFGQPTDEEIELGLDFPAPAERGDDNGSWPTEQSVIDLARAWSLDPLTLDERTEKGLGWYGLSPRFVR